MGSDRGRCLREAIGGSSWVARSGRALFAAWLLAAVFCLRDLETAVLYYPPGREPLIVRIFTLEANGPEPIVAALATSHVLVTTAVLAAGGLLLRAGEAR